MNDTKREPEREKPARPAVQREPFLCDECGAVACYGFGSFLLKGIRGTWFCADCASMMGKHPDDRRRRGEI